MQCTTLGPVGSVEGNSTSTVSSDMKVTTASFTSLFARLKRRDGGL
ncbi:hypothetical protein [Methanobrevibacter boviskoreani]|nr:hypothetical protein [Methanobrevibacter boviskoreani]